MSHGKAVIAACAVLCFFLSGCSSESPAPTALPRVSQICIVEGPQGPQDTNLKAYEEVFDSVSLKWILVQAKDLEKARVFDPGLVLVIPAEAARGMSAPQSEAVMRAVEAGALLITEEINPLSLALGIREGKGVVVSATQEIAYPDVVIRWKNPVKVVSLELPEEAVPLNRDRASGRPLAALLSHGRGQCLVLATELDNEDGRGFKRYPYLVQELVKAGVTLPFRSERLSALFDFAYHRQDDVNALAQTWRSAGIASLHVGSWDFFDLEAGRKEYLKRLIEACHRNGILVYAWLEWPHVSQLFWTEHPEWRERTATGRDASVDWRSLMNLQDPECFKAATDGLRRVLLEFDWDGVNMAELYFESPSGPVEPQFFTPMNKLVRRDYQKRFGIDPAEFFNPGSVHYWRRDRTAWAAFVDYRVHLERDLNERVLQFLSDVRRTGKPWLDLILLYVDNIYDPKMREGVGADLTLMLPLLDKYDFTLVMEDPWTVWHLGPRRYAELAASYARLTSKTDRLGIDINIVDRAQQVFPTKKQTGSEFLQLFHYAGKNFGTVMAYSEATMLPHDRDLVSYALGSEASVQLLNGKAEIRSSQTVVFHTDMEGETLVDGRAWPCAGEKSILVPAGTHEIAVRPGPVEDRPRLVHLNGSLKDAAYTDSRAIGFSYYSKPRAIAIFDRPVRTFKVDQGGAQPGRSSRLMLPPGSHQVRVEFR